MLETHAHRVTLLRTQCVINHKKSGKKSPKQAFSSSLPRFFFFGVSTVVAMEALVFGYQYSINDNWVQVNLVKIGTNANFSS